MSQVRTRFAPSPTGYMHIGNLRSGLYAYLFARKHGGKFLLRIEDTDQGRFVEGATELIYRTLKDVGMDWDEGPDIGGDYGPYIQSQRSRHTVCDPAKRAHHRHHQLFRPGVRGHHRQQRGSGRQHPHQSGRDAYLQLRQRGGRPSYGHLPCDAGHGIPFQRPQIQPALQSLWYIHMPPIMRDAQHKLSKRDGDASYEDFINKGYLKEAIINYIALLGWNPGDERERFTLAELCEVFDVDRMSKSPAIFDPAKLTWLNGQYIRDLSPADFTAHAAPWYQQAGISHMDTAVLCRILQPRVEIFSQIPDMVDFLAALPKDYNVDLFTNKKSKTNPEVSKAVLQAVIPLLEALPQWTETALHDTLLGYAAQQGMKNGTLLWPVRIALAGKQVTPGGAIEIAFLLGREEALDRLRFGLEKL